MESTLTLKGVEPLSHGSSRCVAQHAAASGIAKQLGDGVG
jgi:hypothetical protein